MTFARFVSLPFQLAFTFCCVLLAYPLHATRIRSWINQVLNIGSIAVSYTDAQRIAIAFLASSGIVLLVMAVGNRVWFLANGKRFANELYAVALASSIAALYVFVATTINFSPAFFLICVTLIFAGYVSA